MYTPFLWLSLEQALSTLSTMFFRHAYPFFCLLSLEQALSTLSTMFFGHVYHFFCLALFGAGSIYPIYHVFRTCIPLFFGLLSLEPALSTLSTMDSRYRHTSSVLGLKHFWSRALIYLSTLFFV